MTAHVTLTYHGTIPDQLTIGDKLHIQGDAIVHKIEGDPIQWAGAGQTHTKIGIGELELGLVSGNLALTPEQSSWRRPRP